MKRRLDDSVRIDGSNTKKQRVLPNTEENNWLDLLPIELVKQILEYLNDDDKRHARLANQQIFSIINITHFNVGFILSSEIDEIISVFGRYPHPISLTFNKPLMNYNDLQRISKLVNLKSLHSRHSTIEVDQMANLQSLELDQVRVTSAWSKLTQLTSLQAKTLSLISGLPTSLQKLKYDVSVSGFDTTQSYSNLTAFNAPLNNIESINSTFPNIKSISFRNYERKVIEIGECLTGLEDLTVTSNIIMKNAQSLTKLYIGPSALPFNWTFTNLTNLKVLQICQLPSNQIDMKVLPKLERLEVNGWDIYNVRGVNVSMLSEATRLTRLKTVLTSQAEFNAIAKLTRLRVLHATLPLNSGDLIQLDLASLKNLTRLTDFNLSVVGPSSVINSSAINKLPNLVQLELANVKDFDSPKTPFMNLSRLTYLALHQCYWISLYSESSYPRDLQYLQMSFLASGLNPSTINLTVLTNLTYLFTNYHVNWDEAAKLTKLKELHLTHEPERDDDIAIFTTLVGLTYLTFGSDFNVSDHVMRLTRLSRLQVLKVNVKNDIPALDDLKERCKYLRDIIVSNY